MRAMEACGVAASQRARRRASSSADMVEMPSRHDMSACHSIILASERV